tara:strand:+ start:114688 stop:115605 length:918 start_codon:yes stop_codon:yes gene_type:complete
MSHRRAIVIINRASGNQDGQAKEDGIQTAFGAHGIAVDFVHIGRRTSVAAATRKALGMGEGTICVAGGDGTISGVTSVMVSQNRPLGIIPQGTFNYFARSLGIPQEMGGAVDIIAAGHHQDITVATINGHTFLNNASIGAYPAILKTREGIYRRWGRSRIAAYWSVIKALIAFRTALDLRLEVDGEERQCRTPLVFAINNAFQLSQMGLGGHDCIAAGKMVLLVAPDTSRLGLLRHAAALALGIARPETDYEMLCGAEIIIHMRRKKRSVARDGEISTMAGPFRLANSASPLKIFVPKAAVPETR